MSENTLDSVHSSLKTMARGIAGYTKSSLRNAVSSHTFGGALCAREINAMRQSATVRGFDNVMITSHKSNIIFSVQEQCDEGEGEGEERRGKRRRKEESSSEGLSIRAIQSAKESEQGKSSAPTEEVWKRAQEAIKGMMDLRSIDDEVVFQSMVVNVSNPSRDVSGDNSVCIAVRFLGGVSVRIDKIIASMGERSFRDAVIRSDEKCVTAPAEKLGLSTDGTVASACGICSMIIEFIVNSGAAQENKVP